jgi:hypothetical protein
MKKFLLASFVCLLFVSLASAEIMMSACPLGKGKWGLMPGATVDFNYAGLGGNAYMMMDALGYGLKDNLDLYLSAGVGYSAKTGMMGTMSMTAYAVNLKYTFLSESLTQPVSLAVDGGVRSMPMSMTSMNQMQESVGLIVSKMLGAFNPYAGITYRNNTQDFGNFTQIDYTIGTGIGPMDRMLTAEYTLQTVSAAGGSYNDSQVAIGACLGLN